MTPAKSPDQILAEFDKTFLSTDLFSSRNQFNDDVSGRLPEAFQGFLRSSMAAVIRWSAEKARPAEGVTHFAGLYSPEETFDRGAKTVANNLLTIADSIEKTDV